MKKIKVKFTFSDISRIDEKTLLLNLYLTQVLTLVVALVFFFFQKQSVLELLKWNDFTEPFLWGSAFAALVIIADLIMDRFVPEEHLDDGGINEKIFKNRPLWHIFLLSFIVAVCEELLFRGAIQHAIGPYWTSIVFATLHVRYLRHWLLTGLIFATSYGLGWIYLQTGSLWTPIIAHFWIDFVMGCVIRYRKDEGG